MNNNIKLEKVRLEDRNKLERLLQLYLHDLSLYFPITFNSDICQYEYDLDKYFIDNYAGKKLFDIIRNINVKVKIYTENIDNISKEKYEKQYSNIEIINTNIFHDRFIIIDNKVLYHSGASFKDLGKKCFAITKILDNNILKELLDKLKKCYEED